MHFLNDKTYGKATEMSAELLSDENGARGFVRAVPVGCDAGNEWAVMAAIDPAYRLAPSATVGQATPVVNGGAYIVPHPVGGRRIGFVQTQISFVDERVVQ